MDDEYTVSEVIQELVDGGFIPSSAEGYSLAKKGGRQLQITETFRDAGVRTGDVIRVIPATDAGYRKLTRGGGSHDS